MKQLLCADNRRPTVADENDYIIYGQYCGAARPTLRATSGSYNIRIRCPADMFSLLIAMEDHEREERGSGPTLATQSSQIE